MLRLVPLSLGKEPIETLVLPVCEDLEIHGNRTIRRLIDTARQLEEFSGKSGETCILYAPSRTSIKRVMLIGLGKAGDIDAEALRVFAGTAVDRAIGMHLAGIHIAVPTSGGLPPAAGDQIEALMEGALLANHLFDRFRSEKKTSALEEISFLASSSVLRRYADLPARVTAVCTGTCLAREWVSLPPNHKRPDAFEKMISGAARDKGLSVTVLTETEMEEMGFGALLAVAAGSTAGARLVVLDHAPKGYRKTVVLVGKGVTFDSGGINLKPAGGLENMKSDMSGAAAVAATLVTIAGEHPETRIVGVLPLVENMPSGQATRPGDVVRTYSGKTVEIGNTDAEGRLILADAISYAIDTYRPDVIIDLATLTGACVMALGEKIAGLFTEDDDLADGLLAAGLHTHERCWRLPLPDDYRDLLKSDIADISNMSSSRWGGAITAALFLREFAGEHRWAHIDIAGPAFVKKKTAYCPAGGSGFGVRLLCRYLREAV